MTTPKVYVPTRLRLDKRADQLIAQGEGEADETLTPSELAAYLKVSIPWLSNARVGGYGPKYLVLDGQTIRYRKEDVLGWLKERTYKSTAETPDRQSPHRGKVLVGDKFVSPDALQAAARKLRITRPTA